VGILFLIGPRGCGKSLAMDRLVRERGCRGCDTDRLIVEAEGKSVAGIVAEDGWAAFRAAEKRALGEAVRRMGAAGAAPGVVATGGGIVLDPENRALMRRSGVAVYLAAPVEALVSRLQNARERNARPPLSGLSFEEEIRAVFIEREAFYRETARYSVDASKPPEAVADALYGILLRHCKETL
jgi:shikimate kinase